MDSYIYNLISADEDLRRDLVAELLTRLDTRDIVLLGLALLVEPVPAIRKQIFDGLSASELAESVLGADFERLVALDERIADPETRHAVHQLLGGPPREAPDFGASGSMPAVTVTPTVTSTRGTGGTPHVQLNIDVHISK